MKTKMPQKYISLAEAALRLGMSRRQVVKLCSTKALRTSVFRSRAGRKLTGVSVKSLNSYRDNELSMAVAKAVDAAKSDLDRSTPGWEIDFKNKVARRVEKARPQLVDVEDPLRCGTFGEVAGHAGAVTSIDSSAEDVERKFTRVMWAVDGWRRGDLTKSGVLEHLARIVK